MGRKSVATQARDLAEQLLAPLPDRLVHTRGVAAQATILARALRLERAELLVAAAWVHDIGYAPALLATGFHPLDGARLLDRLGWAHELSPLVAHHSGARFVASALGLAPALSEYPFEDSLLSDALTFADQTIGPGGRPTSVRRRVDDALRRHGPRSAQARAHTRREPYLLAVSARVTEALEAAVLPAVPWKPPGRRLEPATVPSGDRQEMRHDDP